MSDGSCEWVYEIILRLPFGWNVIRLRPRHRKMLGDQYKSPLLYRKTEIKPGHFCEEYWPQSFRKYPKVKS